MGILQVPMNHSQGNWREDYIEDKYCKQRYSLGMAIASVLLPELQLSLNDVRLSGLVEKGRSL